MRKIILLSSVLCVLGSYAASAQVSVTLGAPAYYPPYVYSEGYEEYHHRYPSQYYNHRHNRNWSYWAKERRDRDDRGRHDNGNHGEGNRGNGYGNRR